MKNIIVVALVFWLLFLNGFSQIKTWLQTSNAPQTIVNGAQRAIAPAAQPQPQVRIIGSERAAQPPEGAPPAQRADATPAAVIIITATPEPPTPTAVIIVPQGLPEAARMPTETPLPTFPPARYPSADQQWAVHEINERGYKQDCVYIYTQSKRVCWSPGIHPSDSDVRWIVGMVEAGNIAGEPIP